MRVVCVIVGALATLLLVLGLANGVWTALNLQDGVCDGCVFPGMNEPAEVLITAVVNLILYGAIIGLAVWGYRKTGDKPPKRSVPKRFDPPS